MRLCGFCCCQQYTVIAVRRSACPKLRIPNSNCFSLCYSCYVCRYGLNVHYLKNPDFKAGLEEYLAEAGTAAIVLGTRRCVICVVCGVWCVCMSRVSSSRVLGPAAGADKVSSRDSPCKDLSSVCVWTLAPQASLPPRQNRPITACWQLYCPDCFCPPTAPTLHCTLKQQQTNDPTMQR